MAFPKAPVDPYCRLNGQPGLVRNDDSELGPLAGYAQGLGVNIWRYPDGKLALTSESYAAVLARGIEKEPVPLVFGGEGATLAQTAAEATSALRVQSAALREAKQATASVAKQGEAGRLDRVEPTPEPIDLAGNEIATTANTFMRDLPTIKEVARDVTGRRWGAGSRFLLPAGAALERLGDGAAVLARVFARRNDLVNRVQAIAFSRLAVQLERLTPDEVSTGYQRFVEHGEVANEARRPVLESVYAAINEVDNWFYDTLKSKGLDVQPKVGAGPLNPTGRYFPHKRDLAALNNPELARRMIGEIQERADAAGVKLTDDQALDVIQKQGWGEIGRDRAMRSLKASAARHDKKLSTKEARELLDDILADKGERISANIERARKFDFDGYITDVRRAYTATWTRNAYRVADVTVFGRHDETVHRLLDQMRLNPDIGPRGLDFGRKLYDLEIGRTRLDPGTAWRGLYGIQRAKLSLAVLANMSQPINAYMAFGLRPFVRTMAEAIRDPRRFTRLAPGRTIAEQSGALPVKMWGSTASSQLIGDTADDLRQYGFESVMRRFGGPTGIVDKALSPLGAIVEGSLTAFRMVENFNRSFSQRAAERYFDQLVEQLAKRGEAGFAHRKIGARIREFDLSPQAVLRAVRGDDAQALREMKTLFGLRGSDLTQFRSDYQSMPLWASDSEMGKFALQYKNFAFNQARFMIRQLDPRQFKKDRERYVRTLATIGIAYPAVGIGLTAVRQQLTGPTLAGEELQARLEDPTFLNLAAAGLIGMTLAGGMGILADIGMTATLGNSYAIRSFAIPPAASSIINGVDAFGSAVRGIVNADPDEWRRVRAAGFRELGGLGGIGEQWARELEGTAEEPADIVGAVFGG